MLNIELQFQKSSVFEIASIEALFRTDEAGLFWGRSMSSFETVEIDRISVKTRIRRDLGDLTPLMESLRRHGLLNPISISDSYELIAGQRRMEAAKRLGWRALPCRIIRSPHAVEQLEVEIEENTARLPLSQDEVAEALERLEKLRRPPWWKRLWRAFTALFHRSPRPQ